MRFIKYIVLLGYFFPAVVFSLENIDLCSSSFSNSKEFIRDFFSDPEKINSYKGRKGYIAFVEGYLSSLQMDTVFNYAGSVLPKDDMESLNWQTYRGTTKEFREERSRILDEEGNVKEEYQGPEGYARYGDEFYGGKKLGDMCKTYINVSAVLSESEKKNLNWKQYNGTTKEFREERSRILDEEGNVKEEYQGPEGYARYGDEFYGGDGKEFGNMFKTYINVSAVLSESEKKNLNWQAYHGTTKEFREERSRILDEEGNVKEEYQGPEGYARYGGEFYGGKKLGDMQKTYINVSAVLSKEEMKDLAWRVFFGNTGQFHSCFEFFKNHGFEDYKGAEGQKKIARLIFKDHLRNTYMNVSALRVYLFHDKDEFKNLRKSGWSRTLSW